MSNERKDDVNSLAHSKWNCKYHVVFAPKYRRKVFYEEKRLAIRDILRTLCEWKGVEIIEAAATFAKEHPKGTGKRYKHTAPES